MTTGTKKTKSDWVFDALTAMSELHIHYSYVRQDSDWQEMRKLLASRTGFKRVGFECTVEELKIIIEEARKLVEEIDATVVQAEQVSQ